MSPTYDWPTPSSHAVPGLPTTDLHLSIHSPLDKHSAERLCIELAAIGCICPEVDFAPGDDVPISWPRGSDVAALARRLTIRLPQLDPDILWQCWFSLDGEPAGRIYRWTRDLGLWSADCNHQGEPVFDVDTALAMLTQDPPANRTTVLEQMGVLHARAFCEASQLISVM